jgi:hypothetical protein
VVQHLLQLGHVARHHGQQVVHLAGHQVRGDDLGHLPEHVLERLAGPRVVAGQGRRDVDLQGEARRRGVEPGADGADDAGVLEPADAVQRRCGGQAHRPGQVDVRDVGVRLQETQQLDVNFIKGNGHVTKQ